MKGEILHVTGGVAVIRAGDSNKFEVDISEFRSDFNPTVGDLVDFDITDGKAHTIYITRHVATMDDRLDKAKDFAGGLFNQAKNNINEENINKAKKLASATASKVKNSLSKIDLSSANNFKIHNKFAVLVLVSLFISMVLPMFNFLGDSKSYFKLVDVTGLQTTFMALTLISLLFGLPRIVSRITAVIFLVALCVPIYDGFSFLSDMGSLFGTGNNMIGMVLKNMKIGLPLLFISTIIFVILQILPGYKTNEIFINTKID